MSAEMRSLHATIDQICDIADGSFCCQETSTPTAQTRHLQLLPLTISDNAGSRASSQAPFVMACQNSKQQWKTST
ncbi:hypothetical protein BKA80DRAFT_271355 [Phyllosticta citrichinensis]